MAPIPITVLGGYLGAGKTTLLNAVLAAADGRRIGVVVNDFGSLGVDVALLAEQASDGIVDLANGCVCCTLGTDLGAALEALAAREPRLDHVVIEASGVADPANLAAWGTVPGFSPAGSIVLAAADTIRRQVDDRYVGREVARQLAGADVVVVTKPDLVADEELGDLVHWLRHRFDRPVIAPTEPAVEVVLAPTSVTGSTAASRGEVGAATTDHEDRYVRWRWEPGADPVSAEAVRGFVDAMPTTVLRSKGVVAVADERSTHVEVQVVGPTRAVTRFSSSAVDAEGLVAIGVAGRLDPHELDALAQVHLG